MTAKGCCSAELWPCSVVMLRGSRGCECGLPTVSSMGLACDRLLQSGALALLEGDAEGHAHRLLRVDVHGPDAAHLTRQHIQMPIRLRSTRTQLSLLASVCFPPMGSL
jgi:hypothetical protein